MEGGEHPDSAARPGAPFFAFSSSSGPAASRLQSSCCFCTAGHGPRFQVCPQGSPPPPCLCTFDNPAASRPAPPHGATLTGDRAPLVCMDHVHTLQACSSSNNKTHTCWRPTLGPTLLTLLPHSAGSLHVRLHLTPSPPPPAGSLVLPREAPLCPHAPGSPRAYSWPCRCLPIVLGLRVPASPLPVLLPLKDLLLLSRHPHPGTPALSLL